MKYSRIIEKDIRKWLFKGKVIILYGARQVGKTTLSENIINYVDCEAKYINCELQKNRLFLNGNDIDSFRNLVGDAKLVVLDEAQTIENIGLLLKKVHDTFPEIQIIATGSSSFDLANIINEPLTGRSVTFTLYPISLTEISKNMSIEDMNCRINDFLVWGMYPDILNNEIYTNNGMKKLVLEGIANNYLYKDILNYEQIKKPRLLEDLLLMLALQIGGEVSFNELGKSLGVSSHTVERYIDLLEKIFVIYRLRSFSRNIRNEIKKSFKVYFYDLGVRNSIINDYNQVALRGDKGALWENFCITERLKKCHNELNFPNMYFWRTHDQKEIDYIEEADGKLQAVEFKWSSEQRVKVPKVFLEKYVNSEFSVVTLEDYAGFLVG